MHIGISRIPRSKPPRPSLGYCQARSTSVDDLRSSRSLKCLGQHLRSELPFRGVQVCCELRLSQAGLHYDWRHRTQKLLRPEMHGVIQSTLDKGVGAASVKASGNASPEARTAATYPRNSSSAKPAIHQTTAQPEKYSCNNHHSTSCDCRRSTGSGVLAPLCQRLPPQTNSAYNLGCRGHVSRGC